MVKWNPEEYARQSASQEKWAKELLPLLQLKEAEHVLDIGSGDGKVTALIAQHVPKGQVLGLDSSPEMVDFARRSFPPDIFPNLKFEVGNASELNFCRNFDVVVSFACLHWVLDHGPVLEGIAEALRPGGRVLLQFGGYGNAADIICAADEVKSRPHWAQFFQRFEFPYGFFRDAQYCAWVEKAGLESGRIELVPKDMVHASRDSLVGWFHTTWMPYICRVPEHRQEAFIDEVIDRYLQEFPPDVHGHIHVAMVRLQVQARKPSVRASSTKGHEEKPRKPQS